ncbi:MAG: dockerin type I domain-containing protein [Candidatus Zixiibacteriota bacterium]
MKNKFLLAGLLLLACLAWSGTCVAADAVTNGNYEGGFFVDGDDQVPNGWIKYETFSGGSGETSILSQAGDNGPTLAGSSSLNWVRSNDNMSGDWTACDQFLNYDVTNCNTLTLTIDVKAFSHSLGGSGYTPEDWEYPVTVVVYYTDTGGTQRYWQWGWYLWIDSQTAPRPDHEQVSGNGVVTGQQIPTNQWVANSFNLLTELTNPKTITKIRVGGSGWDFEGRADNVQILCTKGWYWKPSYTDYAPSGMPDFDQKQDNWKNPTTANWSFCGPTAVANCWWWFDSKYNVPAGVPGDANDRFPLVRDYMDTLAALVGRDDHDPWNVNHVGTAWFPGGAPPATLQPFVPGAQTPGGGLPRWGELVERLAWYVDCDGRRTGNVIVGTNVDSMQAGIGRWLLSEHFQNGRTLADTFYERTIQRPSYVQVESLVEKCEDVILLLGFWYYGPGDQEFIRGDVDANGVVNAADVSRCFAGPPFLCDDAADVNDDGVWNTLDCEYLNNFLAGIGPPPPPPFPQCGPDPTPDALGCAHFSPCPTGPSQWWRVGGHYVTVAGVYSDSLKIAFSDPYVDWAEQGNPGMIGSGTLIAHSYPHTDPTIHNDAGNVSHDIYIVATSPSPGGSWGPQGYPASTNPTDWMSNFRGQSIPHEFISQAHTWDGVDQVYTEVEYAVVVSPKVANRPPQIIQPDTLHGYKVCDTVSYTFDGIDPDGDVIQDQASLVIQPACGTYSVTRISGQGTSTGTWQVTWITAGCIDSASYQIIVDLKDALNNTSYCTTYCFLAPNHPPKITQPDSLSAFVGDQVSYTIDGTDPDGDVILDQASIHVIPNCGSYSITRTSGQGTATGTWQIVWQTNGCAEGRYQVIHDMTDGCDSSYCTTYVRLSQPVGWYWKPSYPDYAPNGMPDFDQKQDNWKKLETGQYSFCGPVAVANCFWWFDSKYQVPPQAPGDGFDMFPLVRDYMDNNPPFMGQTWDDHDPWNVDHVATSWSPPGITPPPATFAFAPGHQPQPSGMPPWGELVERLAWYLDTDGARTGYCQHTGTSIVGMLQGIQMWLASEPMLQDTLCVGFTAKPTFAHVDSLVEKSEDVILLLGFWFEDPAGSGHWYRCGGHYVTMAGVNSQALKIAVSDPYLDAAEMGLPGVVGNGSIIPHLPGHPAPTHNDAGNVSHDIYSVMQPSPSPGGLWSLPDYPGDCYDFNNQNVPDEFSARYRTWNGVSPIFTEVEYALHISPWDYRGDVTGDGVVNASDVVFVINYLFRGGSAPHPYSKGDVTCNGIVDSGDVIFMINYLYKGGAACKCCDR